MAALAYNTRAAYIPLVKDQASSSSDIRTTKEEKRKNKIRLKIEMTNEESQRKPNDNPKIRFGGS